MRVDPRYFRPAAVETLRGDPTKVRERLGWAPHITVQEMLRGDDGRELERRNKFTPPPFGLPDYRAALATQPSKTRDLSVHELLWRLAQHPRAIARYACPMVFDHAELYRPVADLGLLRLVDLGSAPGALEGGAGHSLCFQGPGSEPLWFRPPVAALATSPAEFVGRLVATARDPALRRANNELLLSVIDDPPAHGFRSSRRRLRALADARTILPIRGLALT